MKGVAVVVLNVDIPHMSSSVHPLSWCTSTFFRRCPSKSYDSYKTEKDLMVLHFLVISWFIKINDASF